MRSALVKEAKAANIVGKEAEHAQAASMYGTNVTNSKFRPFSLCILSGNQGTVCRKSCSTKTTFNLSFPDIVPFEETRILKVVVPKLF